MYDVILRSITALSNYIMYFYIGIHIAPPTINAFTCCAVLLCVTYCYLPAKAMIMNFMQFNGFYGCCHCYQKGMLIVLYYIQ